MTEQHADLPDAGRITHDDIDKVIDKLRRAPINVWGARDDPEGALRSLLVKLEHLGLISDRTTVT